MLLQFIESLSLLALFGFTLLLLALGIMATDLFLTWRRR